MFTTGNKAMDLGSSNIEQLAIRLVFIAVTTMASQVYGQAVAEDAIQPYAENPYYWQFKGKPVVLLGGTNDDNLFQIPHLEAHLDQLASVGGNYIRNTMSSRDSGNLWPFAAVDGEYDLQRLNPTYWQRFETCLRLAEKRDIIVQIELWDRFDFANEPWERNPYNPKNNRNYAERESGLKPVIKTHPGRRENRFFRSVPTLENNAAVLRFQQKQVDQMLAMSLGYGNVLYCMDNETSESPEWGKYWSEYIRCKARERGVSVHTTEMWDWKMSTRPIFSADPQHRHTLDHPESYTFIDMSQNNSASDQFHWNNIQWVREYVAKTPRPINTVKVYGGSYNVFYTLTGEQAVERFWRNIIGGLAGARFHRPPGGIGLSSQAQASLRSMRMLLAKLDVFNCAPDVRSENLLRRGDDEAYLTSIPGTQYAMYFPDGGYVELNLRAVKGSFSLQWLDVAECQWSKPTSVRGGRLIKLVTPGARNWIAVLTRSAV
jgi:hypothetical protein